MTDLQIVENVCRVQSRFNELLFQLKNNSSDTIPNLSDLKFTFDTNAGKKYNQVFSYSIDVLVSYQNEIYISLQNSNLGNLPNVVGSLFWTKVDIKNLVKGSFYAGAHCFIRQDVSNSSNFANFHIQSSWNITTLELYDAVNGIFKLSFDIGTSGIYNDNYLVFTTGYNNFVGNPVYGIFNQCNIIQKTSTYLLFKVPNNYYNQSFSITIIPAA
jgi:hypothetical protein